MKMTETEKRELDAWIAENVMGLTLWKETPTRITAILEPNEFVLSIPRKIVRARIGNNPTINFIPTTDPAAAMEVLKKCRDYCASNHSLLRIHGEVDWRIMKVPMPIPSDHKHWTCESNFELCVCLFAKKLFTK